MTWHLDPSHSHVQFSVRHMMVSTVKGKFTRFKADADVDLASIETARVTASVDVNSLHTGEEQRDGHLKSPDFFDAQNHPEITLVTRSIKKDGDSIEVLGDLTIRGTTRPLTLRGEIFGPAKDPWGGQRMGLNLSGEIDREDFGLTWNQALETGGFLVGKKVKIDLDAEFVQK